MRNHKSTQSLFLMLVIAGLAACASPGGNATGGAEPSGDGISIRVANDIMPPTAIIVWAVPETGSRRRLGSVPPNGRRSFSYSPPLQSIRIVLAAGPELDGNLPKVEPIGN